MLLKYFTVFKGYQETQCGTTTEQSTEREDVHSNSNSIYLVLTMCQALCEVFNSHSFILSS